MKDVFGPTDVSCSSSCCTLQDCVSDCFVVVSFGELQRQACVAQGSLWCQLQQLHLHLAGTCVVYTWLVPGRSTCTAGAQAASASACSGCLCLAFDLLCACSTCHEISEVPTLDQEASSQVTWCTKLNACLIVCLAAPLTRSPRCRCWTRRRTGPSWRAWLTRSSTTAPTRSTPRTRTSAAPARAPTSTSRCWRQPTSTTWCVFVFRGLIGTVCHVC